MTTGKDERDDAIRMVSAHAQPWMGLALVEIANLPHGWSGLGEDFRVYVTRRIGPPANPKGAIGALIMNASRKGLICRTGTARNMRKKSSHARETPEWQRV